MPMTASILPITYIALPAAPMFGINIPKARSIKPNTRKPTPVSKLSATMYFLQDICCRNR